jgi:O-antigen/teichoic acid export membrane protein
MTGLVALPVVLQYLPAREVGLLQLVLTVQSWSLLFTAAHITLGSKRGIAQGYLGTFLFAFFQRLKFLVPLAGLAFVVSVVLAARGDTILASLVVIMIVYVILGYLPQSTCSEYFVATKRFGVFAGMNAALVTLPSIGAAVAAKLTGDIIVVAAVQQGLLVIISTVTFLTLVVRDRLLGSYRNGLIDRDCLRYGIRMMPVELTVGTSSHISNILVGSLVGVVHLAVFSTASRLDRLVRGALGTIHNLVYADFAVAERGSLSKEIRRYMWTLIIAGAVISVCVASSVHYYIVTFLPPEYHAASLYLGIMTIAYPAILFQTLIQTMLEAKLRHGELTIVLVTSHVAKIILIVVLGFLFHMRGVAVAMALSSWITASLFYGLLRWGDREGFESERGLS